MLVVAIYITYSLFFYIDGLDKNIYFEQVYVQHGNRIMIERKIKHFSKKKTGLKFNNGIPMKQAETIKKS